MMVKIKSFTARFIIRSVVLLLVIFLTIYLLFNRIAEEFIKTHAESDLVLNIYTNHAEFISVLGNGWREMEIEEAILHFLDLPADAMPNDSIALALFSDTVSENYIIINERGMIGSSGNILTSPPELLREGDISIDKRRLFAEYYQENRNFFEIGETMELYFANRIFHLRSISTKTHEDQEFPAPPSPLTILLYTEVTELINFKNTVNRILIITLSLAGAIILATTFRMSRKFNLSIKKLSAYAEQLGRGIFDAKIDPLRYSEFQALANSMTDMSTMLATYEVNQKQFFQNASHELRTPLMAVQCYSEGILAEVFTPNDAAIIINSEIEKMTELVSSILYLSRIDHHTFCLEPASTNEFITECYNQIKILAENNNKNIRFDPLEKDLQINVDIALLERAVLNILSNALRYVKTEIHITAEKYLNRNIFANIKQEMVRINISNDGSQIDEKDLPYLFDRFYKGDGGNTGLGLSITKEIITALGGKIKVENTDFGVNFTFDLPVYEQEISINSLH